MATMTPYYDTSCHNLRMAEGVIVTIYSKPAVSEQSFPLSEVDMFNIRAKTCVLDTCCCFKGAFIYYIIMSREGRGQRNDDGLMTLERGGVWRTKCIWYLMI